MGDALKHLGVVILAAGKGKRMNGYWAGPKVLAPLLGKPILTYLLGAVKQSIISTPPVVVIAPDLYVIRDTIGPVCEYAIQESQLGTGHAVLSAKGKLFKYEHLLVLYGDHPLITATTINTLVRQHLDHGVDITLTTLALSNFEGWFSGFDNYGRIIRDQDGKLLDIVERKDATKEQQAITEVNVGYYLFKTTWLWSGLPRLSRDNAHGEYYLTDLIALALKEGRRVKEVALSGAEEAWGVNTPEQLLLAEQIMSRKLQETARLHLGQLPL